MSAPRIRRRRARAERRPARGDRHARSPTCAASTRRSCRAPLRVETAPGVRLRAHQRADARGRPVCAGGLRAAALDRHHAGGAGRDRRLSGARAVHRPDARRRAPIRRCWSPRARRASSRSSRSAARRRSPPWPTAPSRCRSATRSSVPAMPGSTAAKLLVASDPDGAAADLPAGVTEVMVIADDSARADFVAADLLAQAEHGADAQALLVTTGGDARRSGRAEVERQARAAVAQRDPRGIGRPHAADRRRLAREPPSRSPTTTRPSTCCCRCASRARGCARVQRRGRGVPRPLVAGIHGRLLQRPESHPADLRLCARLQRPVARGFPEAHHRAGAHAGGAAGLGPTAQVAGAASKDWTRMPRRSRSASARARARLAMNPLLALARPEIVALKPYCARRVAAVADAPARQRGAVAAARAMPPRAGLNRYPEPQPRGADRAPRRALRRAGRHRCSRPAAAMRPSTCCRASTCAPARTRSCSARRPSACTRSRRASRVPA